MHPARENSSPDPERHDDGGDDGNDVVYLGQRLVPLSMVPPGRFREQLVAHQQRRRCCMLRHGRQTEEAIRQWEQIPPDVKENVDIEGDSCPCDKCIGHQPRGAIWKYMWQDRIIHYAF